VPIQSQGCAVYLDRRACVAAFIWPVGDHDTGETKMWMLQIFALCASLVAVGFLWTTDTGFVAKLVATGLVAASAPMVFVTSWGIHFIIPFLMQIVVAVWALLRLQMD